MNTINIENNADIAKDNLQKKLRCFQKNSSYIKTAELLAQSLKNIPKNINHQVFGYIPHLFRQIELNNILEGIKPEQVYIGEPVIYKITFPHQQTIGKIAYFYIFCYLKNHSPCLNVYFQSAAGKDKKISQKQYNLIHKKVKFEGIISAFEEPESVICISDPGRFIPGLPSSFYVGTKEVNFTQLISFVIENICSIARIKLSETLLFGSSAGGMGALLSSTYFSKKVQVVSVNTQIVTHDFSQVMNTLLGTKDRATLLKKFGDRVSCLHRFQQDIKSVPNIYLLSNVNDELYYQRNYKFFQLYQRNFALCGAENQSVFDSYVGVPGHGRPDKASLKEKIKIARKILTMNSNSGYTQSFETEKLVNNIDLERLKIRQSLAKLQLVSKKLSNQELNQPQPASFEAFDLNIYQNRLSQADNLCKQDILRLKLTNAHAKYPEIGELSQDEVVIAGKENWLYINSGSNNLLDYHLGIKQISALEIKQWTNLLQQRIEWHQEHNISYQHLFVPNKIAVYPEYYPYELQIKRDRPILKLQQECNSAFLYPNNLFWQQKSNYRLYNKQDCHWNFWGCYFAYCSICDALGILPNKNLLNIPIEICLQKGDLGNKFGIKERALNVNVEFNSRVANDNQLINYCHQGSIRVLKNDHITHGKMIIFGDSFSNPGFPNYTGNKRNVARLTSLFAETLNEVHFVWAPWIDYDYIEREKPDFVLTEMAERFLVRVPNDHDHLPLEEYAAMRLDKYKSRAKS